jgi:hypothetical protein
MSNRTRALVLPTALALALLSGCGGDDPADTETDGDTVATATATSTAEDDAAVTSAPADDAVATTDAGGTVSSSDDAFTFTAPPGWSDATEQAGSGAVAAARADERSDDFFTNLVVVTEEPLADLEQAIEEAAEQIAGADGTYELLEETEIDGLPAFGYQIARTVDDVDIVQVQRWVEHEDVLYILTLSAADSQLEAAQAEFDEILATWSWQ